MPTSSCSCAEVGRRPTAPGLERRPSGCYSPHSASPRKEPIMSADAPALTDKQIAVDALDRMPETATLQEISEQLAILAGIRKGERDADEGRVVSHEEAKRMSPDEWRRRILETAGKWQGE